MKNSALKNIFAALFLVVAFQTLAEARTKLIEKRATTAFLVRLSKIDSADDN